MTFEREISQPKISSTYISQGDFSVCCNSGDLISTILGSCVATCLWDPVARVGGMNHFLLPDGTQTPNEQASSFGANSMELLINALIKAGARRDRIRAKVFGGAEMYKGLTDAGARNSEFVLSYLQTEEIPLDGQSLGGSLARRIEFDPISGRARQKLVPDACIQEKVVVEVATNDLELF